MTPPPQNTPSILYKYRFFDPDGYHLRMIKDAEIWFASAQSFNDPFDSSLQFDFDGVNTELAEKWARKAVERDSPHLTQAERNDVAARELSKFRSDPAARLTWFKKYYSDTNYKTFGICSLTPIPDSLLMWGHYANGHKGFCVGIDTKIINALKVERARINDILSMRR